MKCLNCHFENLDGAKFCSECGNRLKHTCPECSSPYPLGSEFCPECGNHLIISSNNPLSPPAVVIKNETPVKAVPKKPTLEAEQWECSKCGSVNGSARVNCWNCDEASEQDSTNEKPKSLIWVVLIFIPLIGTYAALLIPAFAGAKINPMGGYGSMLWSGALIAAVWRYRSKNGWVGFGLGAVLGVLVFLLAAFISGFVGGE